MDHELGFRRILHAGRRIGCGRCFLPADAAVIVLRDGRAPANLNLDRPDPDCDLDLIGPEPRSLNRPVALKNSFGFGGNNAVLVLRQGDTS